MQTKRNKIWKFITLDKHLDEQIYHHHNKQTSITFCSLFLAGDTAGDGSRNKGSPQHHRATHQLAMVGGEEDCWSRTGGHQEENEKTEATQGQEHQSRHGSGAFHTCYITKQCHTWNYAKKSTQVKLQLSSVVNRDSFSQVLLLYVDNTGIVLEDCSFARHNPNLCSELLKPLCCFCFACVGSHSGMWQAGLLAALGLLPWLRMPHRF